MNAITEAEMADDQTRLRIPPQSVEAEQSVLGALLLDNAAWDRVGDVLVDADFYRHEHRLVFAAIAGLVNACKPADVVTVFERLRDAGDAEKVGGLGYINALAQSVVSATNVRRHAEIVREKRLRRDLIAASDEAATLAFSGEEDAQEMADRIATRFADLQQATVRAMPQHASELLPPMLDRISAMASGEVIPGMATGIASIDDALNGGLRGGKIYVLAARPSVGKSSLAQAILLHMAGNGFPGLMLSQEMGKDECIERAASNIAGVDYERVQTGTLDNMDWARLSDGVETLRRLPFYVDDEGGLSLAQIRAKAVAMRRQGIKLLVLDYLQLCARSGKAQNRNSEIEEISSGLKKLAKDLDIAVLLLSQLNREVERRATPEPNLSDLRDSGAIEQDADVVLMLWNVREFTEHRIMGLTFAKNRQGKFKGRLALEFHGQYQRWNESSADITPRRAAATSTGGFDQ